MVSYTVPTPANVLVPETLLKKQNALAQASAKAAIDQLAHKKDMITKRREIFKRAKRYHQEYQANERKATTLRRQAKANGNFYVPAESKLLLVVRIRGINNIDCKPRKVLKLLRLLQINNAVFLKANKASLAMLQLVEPYVTYGTPNLKTIRELLYKRGYGKINKQRIPLYDNGVVQSALADKDILSIEDVVHQIATVGPHFKQVNNFLWPFKLSNPNGGWRSRKFRQFVEGGDAGDRADFINTLVQKMN